MNHETNRPSPEAYELPEDALDEITGGVDTVEPVAFPLFNCQTCGRATEHRKLPDSFSWQCTSCGRIFYQLNQIMIRE